MKISLNTDLLKDTRLEMLDVLVLSTVDTISVQNQANTNLSQLSFVTNKSTDNVLNSLRKLKSLNYIDCDLSEFDKRVDADKLVSIKVTFNEQAVIIVQKVDKDAEQEAQKNKLLEQALEANEITEQEDYVNVTKEIITFLNNKTKQTFRPTTQSYQKLVYNLLNDGYSKDIIKQVIEQKAREWIEGPNKKYLRPNTLLSEEHFDEYYNELNLTPVSHLDKYKVDTSKEDIMKGW